ncbi:hypothetical protein HF888_00195 [Bermanella marisrubri]|uniref:Cell wall surface anchor family protein n=1 Tax=Bermanella marisrubri TaxID=207949 RepID=Q1MZ60_9GAMM|nr:hypothetical protein [Bermanella marisrubri]EAT11273.1 cell wall surface anchor family protein [Oceanobacter sp. RED65] [Bermanella marisrubri]QIZ82755.1 hypothetical protein HF888_00195 [Bermanella marisrubri]
MFKFTAVAALILSLVACGGGANSEGPNSEGRSLPTLDINTTEIKATINDSSLQLEATTNSDAIISYSSLDENIVEVDKAGLIEFTGVGSTSVIVEVEATETYSKVTKEVPVIVMGNTVLTKTAVLTNVKFEPGLSLSGVIESNSEGALSFTSLSPSLLEIEGGVFKILGAGKISFEVQISETLFYPSIFKEFTFEVEKGDGFLKVDELKPMIVGDIQIVSANTHNNVGVDISVLTTDLLSISEGDRVLAKDSGVARLLVETKESEDFKSAQEEVSVLVIPNDLIGVDLYASSARLRVNDLTTGLELLYSSSDACDPLSIESCADYKIISLDSTPITISTMSQSDRGYVWLRTSSGDLTKRTVIDSEANYGHFSARNGHQVVSFNNAYWLIGGDDGSSGVYSSEIWKSVDGYFWELVTDSAPFGGRAFHQVVEFEGDLYLIGGSAGSSGSLADVWKSSNGEEWILVTEDGGYGARYYHQVTVHDGSLILVGGRNASNHSTRDVWSSSDGETWQLLNNAGGFNSLYGHQVVSFDSHLWLIGGYGGSYTHEIWKSYDGTSWSSVTNPTYPDFPSLALFQAVATDSNIWVFPDQYVSEVWTCCSWKREQTTVAFPLRPDYQAVERFDSGFLFIGGGSFSKRYQDVWTRQYQLIPVRFSFQ